MSAPWMDEDALIAAVDLVGRTGATGFEIGYLHDDVPVAEAGWYAHAQYQGARIIEEDHRDPLAAAEGLARRLLTGGKCTHCGGLVTLSDHGAMAYPGHLTDGSTWGEAEIRAAGQCRYRRDGQKWVRGCADSSRPGKGKPKRRKRPKAKRR